MGGLQQRWWDGMPLVVTRALLALTEPVPPSMVMTRRGCGPVHPRTPRQPGHRLV